MWAKARDKGGQMNKEKPGCRRAEGGVQGLWAASLYPQSLGEPPDVSLERLTSPDVQVGTESTEFSP